MLWLLFILGAVCAGFIQGLTGFAFALVAMSFWVWILPPQLAASLVVFASVWGHLISLKQEKQPPKFDTTIVLPYLIAGLIGVPLGIYLLHLIKADTFKFLLALFLILWSLFMFYSPQFAKLQQTGRFADSCIGFIGGVLGGLGGFSGSIPSAWLMLRNLPKEQQRYILRHFNFAIQLLTLGLYLYQGLLNFSHLPYLVLLILCVSIPAIYGARLFYKISERQFKHIVLSLLFASGCFLLMSSLLF